MHNIFAATTHTASTIVVRAADRLISVARTAMPTIAAKPGVREYHLGVTHV